MQPPLHPLSLSRWIWINFLGWLIGLVGAILMGDLVGGSSFVMSYFATVVALSVAFMQWLLLRRFSITARWIWLTALGVASGFIAVDGTLILVARLADIQLKQDNVFLFLPLHSSLGGLACGWLQAKYQLSRVSRETGWIKTQLFAWSAATTLVVAGLLATYLLAKGSRSPVLFLNFPVIFGPGALLGWITGKKLKSTLGEQHQVTLPPL